MKSNTKLLTSILLTIAVLGLIGCKQDKPVTPTPPPVVKNHFKVNDKSYDLSQAFLVTEEMKSTRDTVYAYFLLFLSKGFSIAQDSIYDEPMLLGIGDGIAFEMYSDMFEALDSGEYTYNSVVTTTTTAGTFDEGIYVINYDMETEESNEEAEITNGKVKVAQNDDAYTIYIDCINEYGKKVTGFYKGKVQILHPDGRTNRSLRF